MLTKSSYLMARSVRSLVFPRRAQGELQISECFAACKATDYASGADASGSATLLGKVEIAPDFQVLYTLRLPGKIKLHYHRPNLTAFAAVWPSRDEPAASLQLLEDAYFRQTYRHSQYLYWQFHGRGQGDRKA